MAMSENMVKEQINLLTSIKQKRGKIKIGVNEVTKTIERGSAKFVVIADDVNPKELVAHLPIIAKEKGIAISHTPAKEDLGKAVGLKVGTSAIAIVDEGENKAELQKFIEKLKAMKE